MKYKKRYMPIVRQAADDLLAMNIDYVYKLEVNVLKNLLVDDLEFPVAAFIYQRIIDIMMQLDEEGQI